MVNAFLRFNPKDWHLCIYGDGNYQHDLREIASKTNCIEYYGTQPNDVVVKRQLTASLLINPRLTDAEYVKYSFPSKTMECMVSGTPLLTTRLPGMPAEYYDYVYFIDDESEDGMVEAFNKILDKSPEELHSFGTSAKQFIISEKTNIKQAKKFVDFIVDVRNEYYESY